MSKKEQERIKLLDVIKKDKNKIEVCAVTELFCGLFGSYFDMTKTGKKVKNKLSEDEFISFVTGICNSFLSSLYVTGGKTVKEQNKRMDYVSKVNSDVLVSMEDLSRKE